MRKINRIVIHHSESPAATTTVELINKWHIARGFNEIGYHKVIYHNGKVLDGRKEDKMGAHVKNGGWNHGSLAVCICGNYDLDEPSDIQLSSLYKVLANWCRRYKIDPELKSIVDHCDAPNETKTCSGKNIQNKLPLIRKRISVLVQAPYF